MRVTVLYRTREHFAESYCVTPANLDHRHYEVVCHLEDPAWDAVANPKAVLEEVFEVMNVKRGDAQTEVPLTLKCRSLSVGDVVIVAGQPWLCAASGWQPIANHPGLATNVKAVAKVVAMHYGGQGAAHSFGDVVGASLGEMFTQWVEGVVLFPGATFTVVAIVSPKTHKPVNVKVETSSLKPSDYKPPTALVRHIQRWKAQNDAYFASKARKASTQ